MTYCRTDANKHMGLKGWLYGGEGSGHLLSLDCHTTGDGIVSALQVLSAMRRQKQTLAGLTADLDLMPQALVNAKVERGFDWKSHVGLVSAVGEVERELNGAGRVLIRPSGTEPVLRVMVDPDGRIYNGDELLYVIVHERMRRGAVDGVVGTLMTNYALERRFRELGVPFARAKVGDRYVLEMLEEKGWLYGGEGSGHLLTLDCHTTGDGIVSDCRS